MQRRLEEIGAVVVRGYSAALDHRDSLTLANDLNTVIHEQGGRAHEGAPIPLALLDNLTPWNRRRIACFLKAGASRHIYMVHIGIGWALARLRRRVDRAMCQLDPVLLARRGRLWLSTRATSIGAGACRHVKVAEFPMTSGRSQDGIEQLVARGEQHVATMHRDGDELVAIPVPEILRSALRPFL